MKVRYWELYKNSDEGRKIIELFDPIRAQDIDVAGDIFRWQEDNYSSYEERIMIDGFIYLAENIEYQQISLEGKDIKDAFVDLIDEFEIKEFVKSSEEGQFVPGNLIIGKDKYRDKLGLLSALSVYLYLHYDFFKPILFQSDFDIIQRSCETLDIALPPIPQTKDYREYLLYYYDICVAFASFQERYKLTDAEFCACLYGFAPMDDDMIEGTDLPEPTNIWMTGASKYDIREIEKNGISESTWACNERTKRGDIVVLYALSPYSCIHSIWRASSNGVFNPFDYYHCRTKIRDGIIVPPVINKELKDHPYFSQLPIVRRNLQGVNGIGLSAQDYIELLQLLRQKGFEITKLPVIFSPTDYMQPDIQVEKDVEEKIFIPLLEKLGYAASDYVRQLSMKTGRGKSAIPDFVFFPSGEKHFERSPFIAEAKLMINTAIDFNNAFEQAYSYANILHSSIMAIFDRERIIVYRIKEGMPHRDAPVFERYWASIFTDASVFYQLKQLIGKEAIK